MNKLVKVTASGGQAVFYINGAQVLYYQSNENGSTAIIFGHDKVLLVETPIAEIMAQLP